MVGSQQHYTLYHIICVSDTFIDVCRGIRMRSSLSICVSNLFAYYVLDAQEEFVNWSTNTSPPDGDLYQLINRKYI